MWSVTIVFPAKRMRILIADDYALFRHGVKAILADHFPDAVLGEAATSKAALARARKSSWDIMLLDYSMPGSGGVEILEAVRKFRPELPILILCISSDEQYAVRVLNSGA